MRILGKAVFDRSQGERVRYQSAYACIRCGCTIYEYCGLDAAAPESEPFLLCPPCRDHLNSTGDAIARVLPVLRRNPVARQSGFARERLPYVKGHDIPDVEFAFGPTMRRTAMPILLASRPVLSLFPPEAYGGPTRMTITLGDVSGRPETIVEANHWMPPGPAWRFAYVANRYAFESPDGSARLDMSFEPGSIIRIERLRCHFGSRSLDIDAKGAWINGRKVEIPSSVEQLVGVELA